MIINFEGAVEVRNNYGFNNNEMRRAKRIVERSQKMLQERWREIHG